MSDVAEFLGARLDDDEGALENAQWGDNDGTCYECGTNQGRLLREAEAKRAILAEYRSYSAAVNKPDETAGPALSWGCKILRSAVRNLAAVYRDHPDYDEKWVPGG